MEGVRSQGGDRLVGYLVEVRTVLGGRRGREWEGEESERERTREIDGEPTTEMDRATDREGGRRRLLTLVWEQEFIRGRNVAVILHAAAFTSPPKVCCLASILDPPRACLQRDDTSQGALSVSQMNQFHALLDVRGWVASGGGWCRKWRNPGVPLSDSGMYTRSTRTQQRRWL
eukprot:3565958-Rhodomonas_salina.8